MIAGTNTHFKLCFTRETLLGQLSTFIKQTRDNFMQKTHGGSKGIPKGKNVPEAVNNISWVQQLIAKVCCGVVCVITTVALANQ